MPSVIILAVTLNMPKSCLCLTSMIINLIENALPGSTIGTLYKSKILGFCGSLKSGSIDFNITTGVYMKDQDLVAADPKELRLAKSMELTWSCSKVGAGARSATSSAYRADAMLIWPT